MWPSPVHAAVFLLLGMRPCCVMPTLSGNSSFPSRSAVASSSVLHPLRFRVQRLRLARPQGRRRRYHRKLPRRPGPSAHQTSLSRRRSGVIRQRLHHRPHQLPRRLCHPPNRSASRASRRQGPSSLGNLPRLQRAAPPTRLQRRKPLQLPRRPASRRATYRAKPKALRRRRNQASGPSALRRTAQGTWRRPPPSLVLKRNRQRVPRRLAGRAGYVHHAQAAFLASLDTVCTML